MPFALRNVQVTVDGHDLTDHVQDVVVGMNRAAVDNTIIGAAGKSLITGFVDGVIRVGFLQDFQPNKVDQVLQSLFMNASVFTVTVQTPGSPVWSMTAQTFVYQPVGGEVGAAAMTLAEFLGEIIVIPIGAVVGVRAIATTETQEGTLPNSTIVVGARAAATTAGRAGTFGGIVGAGQAIATATGNVGTIQTWLLSQSHYRFRNDDGGEITATWQAAVDTVPPSMAIDTLFRLRIARTETHGGVPPNNPLLLQWRQNGGAWTALGAADGGAVVQSADSPNVTGFVHTTQQITTGSFTTNGLIMESSGGFAPASSARQSTEMEYVLTIGHQGGASSGDTFDFRLLYNGLPFDSYDVTPSISIT